MELQQQATRTELQTTKAELQAIRSELQTTRADLENKLTAVSGSAIHKEQGQHFFPLAD